MSIFLYKLMKYQQAPKEYDFQSRANVQMFAERSNNHATLISGPVKMCMIDKKY